MGITDSEAFDCFVFGSATSTVGAANGFCMATTMFITTVVSNNVSHIILRIPSLESHLNATNEDFCFDDVHLKVN
jgi:hypothetical protein